MAGFTLPITNAGVGNQLVVGSASVVNVSATIAPNGLYSPKAFGRIAVHRNNENGASVVFAFAGSGPWAPSSRNAPFIFDDAALPDTLTTAVTLGNTARYGAPRVTNSAFSIFPDPIYKPAVTTPRVYFGVAGAGGNVSFLFEDAYTPPNVLNTPFYFGGQPSVGGATLGTQWRSGEHKVVGVPVLRPTAIAPTLLVSKPRVGNQPNINFLFADAYDSPAPSNTPFYFGGGLVASGVSIGGEFRSGAALVTNAAATIAHIWSTPSSRVGRPAAYFSTSNGATVNFKFVQEYVGHSSLNIPFYFVETRLVAPSTWVSGSVSSPVVTGTTLEVLDAGNIAPGATGSPMVAGGASLIKPPGIYRMEAGTPSVENLAREVTPGGIAVPSQTEPNNEDRQVPDPWTSFRTRAVTQTVLATPPFPTAHQVAFWYQYVDVAGRGVSPEEPGDYGYVGYRVRPVYPQPILAIGVGEPMLGFNLGVYPSSWEEGHVPTGHAVARYYVRITPLAWVVSPNQVATLLSISNRYRDVNLHDRGWKSGFVEAPSIRNVRQYFKAAFHNGNNLPDKWPLFAPTIANVDRAMYGLGFLSSRFTPYTDIRNKGRGVQVSGGKHIVWGADTFIAHRHRALPLTGFASSRFLDDARIRNLAYAILPPGIEAPATTRPVQKVAQRNQNIVGHSGRSGTDWGAAFIAYAVRTLTVSAYKDPIGPKAEVRHNPFPIAPVGIPNGHVWTPSLRIDRRMLRPSTFNVFNPQRVGQPRVVPRNRSVYPNGYDLSEYGRAFVELFHRPLGMDGFSSATVGTHEIAFRTKKLFVSVFPVIPFPTTHLIRKTQPDPPGLQRIVLDRTDGLGQPAGGDGIAPGPFGEHRAFWATLFPESIEPGKVGDHRARYSGIRPRFIFEDGLLGVPTFVFMRFIRPSSIKSLEGVSTEIRMTPWTIYAPVGDAMSPDYNPKDNNAHLVGGLTEPDQGSSFPWFGISTITTKRNSFGPVPSRLGIPVDKNFDYFPKYGFASVTQRLHFISPPGIRSLRMGSIRFRNIPQFISLDEESNHGGIPPTNEFPTHVVAYPPVQVDPNRRAYFTGFDSSVFGQASVELLHRAVSPVGIEHTQFFYGIPVMGWRRTYAIVGTDMTLWGKPMVAYRIRHLLMTGWINCSLEDDNIEDFYFPMKVRGGKPKHFVPGIAPGAAGLPVVTHGVRDSVVPSIYQFIAPAPTVRGRNQVAPSGWLTELFGDVKRWEANKAKATGYEQTVFGTAQIHRGVFITGVASLTMGAPRLGAQIYPLNIPDIAFTGPTVTNQFGCTNRAVAVAPIISIQAVAQPSIAKV